MNLIARMELELVNCDIAAQQVNYNLVSTFPAKFWT